MSFSVMLSFFTLKHLLLALFGSSLGIIFGAIPGLSSVTAITILLPMTFSFPAETGIILLVSIWIGGTSGGLISAILMGIPGTAASIATCFDGYPLSKKGQSVKALGAGIVSSFIGTMGSLIIAALVCPFIAGFAVMLGPWELFSLCFAAIILVVTISKGDMWTGLMSAFLGLFLSSFGYDPLCGTSRFSFGIRTMRGGISLTAFCIGMLALSSIMVNFAKGDTKSPDVSLDGIKGFGITFRELRDNLWLIIKSFFIGLWIGFLPGMGAGLSNMVAYAQAKSSSKHPEEFGQGSLEGIIAPEVSNNASVGGALLPMITLGIPGDTVTSLLLGGLMVHGIEAGPLLLTNSAEFVNAMFFGCLLGAVLVLVLQFFGMRSFPFILRLPFRYLFSTIVMLCFIGTYSSARSMSVLWVLIVMTVVGLLLRYLNFQFSPLLLGFILGPMLEKYLRRGLSYSSEGWITFLTRPISGFLLIFSIASLFWPFIRKKLEIRRKADTSS